MMQISLDSLRAQESRPSPNAISRTVHRTNPTRTHALRFTWVQSTLTAIVLLTLSVCVGNPVWAQDEDGNGDGDTEPPVVINPDLAPPTDLKGEDHPWDTGEAVELSWTGSSADTEGGAIVGYRIEKREFPDGEWESVDDIEAGEIQFEVGELQYGQEYQFRIAGIAADDSISEWVVSETVIPRMQFFKGDRFPLSVLLVIFCGSVVYWIFHARSGKPIKVRKIGGLEAVDEAVGRATEMGRSCLYVPGIQDINEIQTIASMTMLSRVAKTAAEYDAKVEVPTARSLVMTTARETVQAAYLSAGRPDAYNEDLIYYVTDEQFGYVAYLQGMMVREKPAACFYMGAFFAESLILAETGNSIGAIQVAGTAMPAQLPFFVAACDYTLIGEEFFAASAYLSGSPEELGSLKGQDVGKVMVGALVSIGVVLYTIANVADSAMIMNWVNYLKETILA